MEPLGPARDYSRLEATAFTRTRLSQLTALIVGAGALGNEVIKDFALLGAGRLVIVDRDHVELSNLTRSVLFCTPDIGEHIAAGTPKAVFAAARAREINPDVKVEAIVGEIADIGLGVIRRADLVFSCLDNELARLELSWACNRMNRPLIDAGLGLVNYSSGQVSVFPGAEGPCYACRKGAQRRREMLEELQSREDSCAVKARVAQAAGMVSTTPLMSSALAAFQVEVALRRWLDPPANVTEGIAHRMTLHPKPSIETDRFGVSPSCPLHEPASVVRSPKEYPERRSSEWTPRAMFTELGLERGFLQFDWPISAEAVCRGCAHTWQPLVRRARFRKTVCPACGSADVAETLVLDGVDSTSSWADKTLQELGLPAGHVHEIVCGTDADSPRVHVEVTGDLPESVRRVPQC